MIFIPHLITPSSITAYHPQTGEVFSIGTDNHSAKEIINLLKSGVRDLEGFFELFSVKKNLISYTNGTVSISGNKVMFKGEELDDVLSRRILQFRKEKLPYKPLLKFLENLMENPSYTSRTSLYEFLEKYNVPITSDGHFVVWKNVRHNFTDIHSGKFDNSPGMVVEMPRNEVNDNNRETCSAGLHVCAPSYLDHFYSSGGKTVACKVNPRDVVSVPHDYDAAKMRCCRYEVLREVSVETAKSYKEGIWE